MNRYVSVIVTLFSVMLILLFVNAISNNPSAQDKESMDKGVEKNVLVSTKPTAELNTAREIFQKITSVSVPAQLYFANELVPTTDPDVKERMDREMLVNTYWHSNTLQLFKLAHKYFPVIEPILKKNGIPDDFKYIALIESGLRNVTSPTGAVGIWQFLDNTGRSYGMEIDNQVDERYNLEKSTQAACEYFLEAYQIFGNWTLAAASYNMGMPGMEDELTRQKVNSYYDLYLRDETSRYIFRTIAVKEIFEHAETYGYYLTDADLYEAVPYKVVKVDTTVDDLVSFALAQGTNYKNLKLLNEWLRGSSLPDKSGKLYEIKIRQ